MILDAKYLLRISNGENACDVLTEFLDEYGDPDYIDNLSDLCQNGGWPDEDCIPEYGFNECIQTNDHCCTAKYRVYFDEKVYGGGCPDMPTIRQQHGEIEADIDLVTGVVTWHNKASLGNDSSLNHLI